MLIELLPLPRIVKDFYIKSGIISLYPPQTEVIKKGLLENKNLLISIPTASGKTLMAEFAMLKSIIERGGKALYIVPLKALASEKFERFSEFNKLGFINGKEITSGISTGDFNKVGEELGKFDIIVVTSEKADSLIRNKAKWIENISVLIVDEIHLVGTPDRGATLEMVIAKLRRISPKLQIVGLSATIGNPEQLAKWLKAELVVSDWRPTDLKEGVYHLNAIHFGNSERAIKYCKDETEALVVDMIKEQGQCLVFDVDRKSTSSKAKEVAPKVKPLLDADTVNKLYAISEEILDNSESDAAVKLAHCVSHGVAFHHAGLTNEHRKTIEKGFKAGLIKVIFATPTLAAGLNLPARRVIIRRYKRYDLKSGISEDIPILEYKQMAGRAGRPHLDPYGECVIIPSKGDIEKESKRVVKKYILGKPEEIESYLGSLKALRIHILSSVATGFITTIEGIFRLLGETFLAYANKDGRSAYLEKNIKEAVDYLITENMVKIESVNISVTKLGALVSHLCIDPITAALIMKGFMEIEKGIIQFTDLTLIHLLCMTNDMPKRYVSKDEEGIALSMFNDHGKELITPDTLYGDQITDPLKIVSILREWINEVKPSLIADGWKNTGEGDVHSIVESANWLSYTMYSIGKYHKNDIITQKTRTLNTRIKYGVHEELLGLVQIEGIGRVRARRLFDAGITTQQKYTEELVINKQRVNDIIYLKNERKPKNNEKKPPLKPVKQKPIVPHIKQRNILDYEL